MSTVKRMKPESQAILEKHIKHWHRIKFTKTFVNLTKEIKEELNAVYRAELDPGYHENLWCGECVMDMMRRLYTHYERAAENPILESTLISITLKNDRTTTTQNEQQKSTGQSSAGGNDADQPDQKEPEQPKNNKRRKVRKAGGQHPEVPGNAGPAPDHR